MLLLLLLLVSLLLQRLRRPRLQRQVRPRDAQRSRQVERAPAAACSAGSDEARVATQGQLLPASRGGVRGVGVRRAEEQRRGTAPARPPLCR